MKADLTGGLDPQREYAFTEPQATPGMQEGVNWWLWDDAGQFGMPRLAVEAYAPDWDKHQVLLNFFEPDGRMLRNWLTYPAHPVIGRSGKASHFGAGPLSFECVEPFHRFRSRFDGEAMPGTFEEMARPAFTTDKRAPLKFDIEAETAVPPWVMGTMRTGFEKGATEGVQGGFMGGDRLEQLCRVKGTINFNGAERNFTGGALRVRRQGVRNVQGFWGHCWQSALFPSGRAFGCNAYPPRPGMEPSYNEGYIYEGEGELIPARLVEAPWLTHMQFSGEDVSLVLETGEGKRHRIRGHSVGGMPSVGSIGSNFPPLLQSIARYNWDGEESFGMMERSNLPKNVKMPG